MLQKPAAAPAAPVAPYVPVAAPQTGLGVPRPGPKSTFRPAALRLDEQGREIDEFGNLVTQRQEAVTTLKVQNTVLI